MIRFGNQLGDADASMPVTDAWCPERSWRKETIVMTECGVDSSPEAIYGRLPSHYHGYSAVVESADVGGCLKRRRRLTAYLDMEAIVVLGGG